MIQALLMLVAIMDGAPPYSLPTGDRMAISCDTLVCAGEKAGSPYRIVAASEPFIDTKERALAIDGTYCSVVGEKRCTSNGRRILTVEAGKAELGR